MMTLDEAIKHCNEVACKHDKCATEHKQLAEWLTELKSYRASITQETQKTADKNEKIRKELMDFIYVTCFPVKDLKKKERFLDWLEKQKVTDEEIIFRPIVGTDIRIAAKQALEKIDIGKKVVLAFNGAYIPVNGKTVGEIDSEYDAWLEKQGKQEPYGQRKECEDCQFNYAGECKGFCQMKRDEQNPVDKVEPKFKVGDWVVYDHRTYQVVELPKEGYINLGLRRNGKVEFAPSPYCRHWSIQDAKDGDVLVDVYGNIGIFDKCYDFDWMSSCSLGNNGGFQYFTVEHENEKTYPATKEQRELLFQKMKEEGWEYDNEKKELKKIKSKTLNADKVIEWLNNQACQGWIEDVEVDKFVDKFKKDFRL